MSEREIIKGLRSLNREVYQLQRRVGAADIAGAIQEAAGAFLSSVGPFCFDYLIDSNWSGLGPEGLILTTFHGHTFKIYSAIGPAVTDANTNRQVSGQQSTFFICSGTYNLTSGIPTLIPPSLAQYSFIGAGRDATIIQPAAGSTGLTLFDMGSISSDPTVTFEEIGFSDNGQNTTLCIGDSIGYHVFIERCNFSLSANNSVGIRGGADQRGFTVVGNLFTGANGTGIQLPSSAQETMLISENHFSIQLGIDMSNASSATHDIQIVSNKFFVCDVGVRLGGIVNDSLTITGNSFQQCDKGIEAVATAGIVAPLHITGNQFHIVGNNVGIDFSPVVSAFPRVWGIAVVGNSFWASGNSSVGVKGAAANPQNSFVAVNIFYNFAPGNEITSWDHDGNEAFHNMSTDDGGLPRTKNPMVDIGSPVGHTSGIAGGEASGSLSNLTIDTIHSGSAHHDPDTNLLSSPFAIDSTGIKTVTIAHGLGYTPVVEQAQVSVIENTAVDDWAYNLLKIVSIDGVNVVAKINVSSASATGGATARLGIVLSGLSVLDTISFGWYQPPIAELRRRLIRREEGMYTIAPSQLP